METPEGRKEEENKGTRGRMGVEEKERKHTKISTHLV